MTLHDVALTRFGTWWRRHSRGGRAYAHGALLHGREPERYDVRACASILCWGLALPLAALIGLVPTHGASALLLGAYGWLWLRVRASRLRLGDAPSAAALYASFITLGKCAEALGVLRGLAHHLRGRQPAALAYGAAERRAA
jgi:hypothetical protein